jgi:hypothetical protein
MGYAIMIEISWMAYVMDKYLTSVNFEFGNINDFSSLDVLQTRFNNEHTNVNNFTRGIHVTKTVTNLEPDAIICEGGL